MRWCVYAVVVAATCVDARGAQRCSGVANTEGAWCRCSSDCFESGHAAGSDAGDASCGRAVDRA